MTALSHLPSEMRTVSIAPTGSFDLEGFIDLLRLDDLFGDFPGDRTLREAILPSHLRRVVLGDEVGEELASIEAMASHRRLSAMDVVSSLWMHSDYRGHSWTSSCLKELTDSTLEITITLEVKESKR